MAYVELGLVALILSNSLRRAASFFLILSLAVSLVTVYVPVLRAASANPDKVVFALLAAFHAAAIGGLALCFDQD